MPFWQTGAEHRLEALGYNNVTVYHRDGTAGLPEQAPFDAIIVSAGGREVPKALCSQLAMGGWLVIPVGSRRQQILTRIIRRSEKAFEEEEHGIVAFVPLIAGEGGETDGSVVTQSEAGELDATPVILHASSAIEPMRSRANHPQRPSISSRIAQAA